MVHCESAVPLRWRTGRAATAASRVETMDHARTRPPRFAIRNRGLQG